MTTRGTGQWAEDLACRHLQERGLELHTRNYLCPHGEIDLIMSDGAGTVFVEVRYRSSADFGNPADTIGHAKQKRLLATANHWLQRNRRAASAPCRFDVVVICGPQDNTRLEWIENAIEEPNPA